MRTEIKVEQRSPEWFEARCGIVTASNMSKVLAKIKSGEAAERKNYRAQLIVERLTGKPIENAFVSAAMQRGIDLEPEARMAYEAKTGRVVLESGFWRLDDAALGASPDGLIGRDGLLEIKCPSLATHVEYLKAGVLPPEYAPQVMTQLLVTGRSWCDFVSYAPEFPESLSLMIVRVNADDDWFKRITKEVAAFWIDFEKDFSALFEKKESAEYDRCLPT